MPAPIQVRACDPNAPREAARAIVERLLPTLPRRRPVTLAVLAQGPAAGLTVTPWVLRGLIDALETAQRGPLTILTLGDADAGEASLRKAGLADGRMRWPGGDRRVGLRVEGAARPARVPRELLGSSLVAVMPMLFRAHPASEPKLRGRPSPARWDGPMALLNEQLALRCAVDLDGPKRGATRRTSALLGNLERGLGRAPRGTEPAELRAAAARLVGEQLLGAVFASASVVLDATWAGALAPQSVDAAAPSRTSPLAKARTKPARLPGLAGELVSPARVLGVPELARAWQRGELERLDRWLSEALGLARAGQTPAPEFCESPGRWPQLDGSVARPRPVGRSPKRLADRAISSIRTQHQRLTNSGPRAALPARVPGPFATLWTQRWYGEGAGARR